MKPWREEKASRPAGRFLTIALMVKMVDFASFSGWVRSLDIRVAR